MATAKSRPNGIPLRDFSKSLPMALLKAREAVMQRFRVSLRAFNITEQQWRVLRALSAVEEIEVTALANATFLLTPSLSRILKDLDDRGLIRRRADPEDLRRGLVSISEEGLKLIAAVAPYSEATYAEIDAAVGPEKMDLLRNVLRELEAKMAELPPVRVPDVASSYLVSPQSGAGRRGRPKKAAG